MSTMPTLYLPHGGGPCFFMDWNPPHAWDRMAAYLRSVPEALGAAPRAMVVVSAHWEEPTAAIQHQASPSLLFDYYGFPEHTYRLTYPAPGAPALAERVAGLLEAAGTAWRYEHERGFDHGVFVPLKVAFPRAEVPIVQLSMLEGLDPRAHLALGEALAPLREEGVLIVGSGMSYHNMRTFMGHMRGGAGQDQADPASRAFDDWLAHALTGTAPAARRQALVDWAAAPGARESHPREEHLLPLHVALGAAGDAPGRRMLADVVMGAAISGYQFG